MLKILIAFIALNAIPAFAEDNAAGFAEHKTKVLAEVDQRIAKMQEHRTCINSATTPDAMKACHEKMREFHEGQRMEHLENHKERIDKKIDRMNKK